MTNRKKLEQLRLHIDSKYWLFASGFQDGYTEGLNMPEIIRQEVMDNRFKSYCFDFNIIDYVDDQYINYSKLILNPDGEYIPITCSCQINNYSL